MQKTKRQPLRRNGYTQARGDIRRQKLLDAAIDLLSTQDIDQVSFVDISRHAGLPAASAYHFYRNKNDLLAALVDLYHEEVNEFVLKPFDRDVIRNWADIIDQIIERAAEYFKDNVVARKLFYSGKAPPEIKLLDRTEDKKIGKNIEQVLQEYFEVPEFLDRERVFFILVELIDTIFILSVTESGRITSRMAEEAKRVTKAYLRTYLPDLMPRK